MEFLTSKTELVRRKKAYLTLLISLACDLFLSSWILAYPVSVPAYIFLAVMFFLMGAFSFYTLDSMIGTKVVISDAVIERIGKKGVEKYSFVNLKNIAVKRRTNGVIRELSLFFENGNLVLNALEEDFEEILGLITRKLGKEIVIKTSVEPIDYDHPLFYSILGLPISFGFVWSLRFAENFDFSKSSFLLYAFAIYLIALGLYFLFTKPLAVRYGNKQRLSDFLLGGIMILLGVVILFVGANL